MNTNKPRSTKIEKAVIVFFAFLTLNGNALTVVEKKTHPDVATELSKNKRFYNSIHGGCDSLILKDNTPAVVKNTFGVTVDHKHEVMCSYLFEKGNAGEERQLCQNDVVLFGRVESAVFDNGTEKFVFEIKESQASTADRVSRRIKAVVCDASVTGLSAEVVSRALMLRFFDVGVPVEGGSLNSGSH